MATPVLVTKLYIPELRPKIVARPRLIERLNEGLHRKLTLLSAPAGSGKTTLVCEWAAQIRKDRGVAWLSLDTTDNAVHRVLIYLIFALQTVEPDLGKSVLNLLESPQPPPAETLLTVIINDISSLKKSFVLVFDDYHLISSPGINNVLLFLLEHMPPQMHILMTTREEPDFPLSRLRACDEITEIRAHDLSFSLEETTRFLNDVMELGLSTEYVNILETRTEGWIAGLQLAAISLRGKKDPDGFIQSFTGSHHYILDYLVEEVIKQQPDDVKNFLLCTSILDRFCGSLCDAVLNSPEGFSQTTIARLEQANLFLIPLDNERRWYRYHHLFADLLRQQLHQKPPILASLSRELTESEIEAELHLRASQWYEENGLEIEAFQHAAAASDIERAERLIEGKGMPLPFRGAAAPVIQWIGSLPKEILDCHPSLRVTDALCTMVSGHPSLVESKLKEAESLLDVTSMDEKTCDLIGQIAALRGLVAASQNNVEAIISQSNRALTFLHPQNQSVRTITTYSLGVAYELQNDHESAAQAYQDVINLAKASGNTMFALAAHSSLADVQIAENKLRQAYETYNQAMTLADNPTHWTTYDPHYGLARIYYEWNNLDAAHSHADDCIRLAPQVECGTVVSAEILLLRLYLARNDVKSAANALEEARVIASERSLTDCASILSEARVDLLLHQGRFAEAVELAEKSGLPESLARSYLAAGNDESALSLLESLRWKMVEVNRPDQRLRIMTLQAVALYEHGELEKALRILTEVLEEAKPGGFIRLFLDEGEKMGELLDIAQSRGINPEYTSILLAAFTEEPSDRGKKPAGEENQSLIEPLSPRELDVLRLIARGLSNKEIGSRLFLALPTVKGYTRIIFNKLHVQRRTEAVARAQELGLL